MKSKQKARIILQHLSNVMPVNWNMDKYYVASIEKALKEIQERESQEAATSQRFSDYK